MVIREINHYPEMGTKSATVELTYEEILAIENALVRSKAPNPTRRRWFYLFEIVKNGCLDPWAIEKLYNLTFEEEEEEDENKTESVAEK